MYWPKIVWAYLYSTNSILLISSAHPFIHIGRLKEQYKLENGNYVCPTPIEEAIDMSRFISQVVVTGDNRPYNIALVVPDWTAIRHELDLPEASEEELVNNS